MGKHIPSRNTLQQQSQSPLEEDNNPHSRHEGQEQARGCQVWEGSAPYRFHSRLGPQESVPLGFQDFQTKATNRKEKPTRVEPTNKTEAAKF